MTVIYEANENRPHFCTTADRDLPLGSICRCECGRFWLRKTVIGDYWVRSWVPVRWYHRTARKRITEWKQQRRIRPIVQSIIATGEPQTLTNKTIVNPTMREDHRLNTALGKIKVTDAEKQWQQADDKTTTKFRVTANVYPSPFAEKTCAVATWTGTRFQIGEMAGEYADESDNPLLHMEIDTVEVLDE